MANKHINLNHSRPGKYDSLLKQITKDGVCPFCENHLKKYHQPPILRKNRSWLLTTNQNPYTGLKKHFLFIHRRHLVSLSQLKSQDWTDLGKLINWAVKTYKIPGGSFFVRFGDTDYTGASVSHLHAHLVSGGKRGKNKQEVTVRLGYHK